MAEKQWQRDNPSNEFEEEEEAEILDDPNADIDDNDLAGIFDNEPQTVLGKRSRQTPGEQTIDASIAALTVYVVDSDDDEEPEGSKGVNRIEDGDEGGDEEEDEEELIQEAVRQLRLTRKAQDWPIKRRKINETSSTSSSTTSNHKNATVAEKRAEAAKTKRQGPSVSLRKCLYIVLI